MDNANPDLADLSPADPSCHEATAENLLALLQSLYWNGVEREICNMILAYSEISDSHPDPLTPENCGSTAVSLDSKNYQSIFRLWCRYFEQVHHVARRLLKLPSAHISFPGCIPKR